MATRSRAGSGPPPASRSSRWRTYRPGAAGVGTETVTMWLAFRTRCALATQSPAGAGLPPGAAAAAPGVPVVATAASTSPGNPATGAVAAAAATTVESSSTGSQVATNRIDAGNAPPAHRRPTNTLPRV